MTQREKDQQNAQYIAGFPYEPPAFIYHDHETEHIGII
jgi:hypothetical protein